MPWRRLLLLPAVLLLVVLFPAAAGAASFTFLDTDDISPPGQGTFGPATVYPATIEVEEVPGTVTAVTVTLLGVESGSPDDMDIGLRGPNGETVMLVSDACGESTLVGSDDWIIEDAAPTSLSDKGPCASNQTGHFLPSNYAGNAPEPDNLAVEGGPSGPYLNQLSSLAGGPANGSWKLFALDDNLAVTGLFLAGWALTLAAEPPPPVPLPAPIVVIAPPVTAPPATVKAAATGKRAAALGRCKAKKTKHARIKCRAKARKLPV